MCRVALDNQQKQVLFCLPNPFQRSSYAFTTSLLDGTSNQGAGQVLFLYAKPQ
jgi:hypothetical protein